MGKQIEIAAEDGRFDAYVAVPDQGKGPGVVLVTHIYGVDRDTQAMCDDLARRGCVALAQNFFWRDKDSGVLAQGPEGGQRARARAGRIDFARAMNDLKRSIAEVKRHPSATARSLCLAIVSAAPTYGAPRATGSLTRACHSTAPSSRNRLSPATNRAARCVYIMVTMTSSLRRKNSRRSRERPMRRAPNSSSIPGRHMAS
jgi:carboxymethylenebutenolidase